MEKITLHQPADFAVGGQSFFQSNPSSNQEKVSDLKSDLGQYDVGGRTSDFVQFTL